MNRYCIFLFSILAFTASCTSQSTSSDSKSLSNADSVALALGEEVSELDSSIWYVYQDRKQQHWFGSNGAGLYRYDGGKLMHYTSKDGLPNDQVRGIQEDQSGNLLIATMGGICLFDGKEFHVLQSEESSEWKLGEHDLWFSLLGDKKRAGVFRYDGQKLYHHTLPKNPMDDAFRLKYPNVSHQSHQVYSIYKDSKGSMWFGTASLGVCRYDGKDFSWLHEDHLTNTPSGGSFGIRSVLEDSKSNFWFCNTQYRYHIEAGTMLKNGVNQINYSKLPGMGKVANTTLGANPYYMSLVEDQHGDIWMATYEQGIFQYYDDSLIHYPIQENGKALQFFSVYKDHQNTLWFGTHNGGVYKYDGEEFEKFIP